MELVSSCKTEAWGFVSNYLKCGFKLTAKNVPNFLWQGGRKQLCCRKQLCIKHSRNFFFGAWIMLHWSKCFPPVMETVPCASLSFPTGSNYNWEKNKLIEKNPKPAVSFWFTYCLFSFSSPLNHLVGGQLVEGNTESSKNKNNWIGGVSWFVL